MRILCISPAFVPLADPEAFCGGKMVLALREQGADVVVLYDPGLERQPGARLDDSDLWKTLKQSTVAVAPPEKRSRLASAYYAVRFMSLHMHPRWVARVVEHAVRLHAEKPFDVVYSRSLPVRAHVAGYACARRLGLPWMANVNDPWDYHLRPGAPKSDVSFLHDRASRYWLRKTLKRADVLTYPCRRLGESTSRFAGIRRSFEVVPHVGRAAAGEGAGAEFRLVHAGRLPRYESEGRRSSGALLNGLAEFLKARPDARSVTKMLFIGPEDAESDRLAGELGMGDLFESTGMVDYEQCLKEITRARVCVMVEADWSEGILLLSKMSDYVAARKPILALSPRVGTVADLLPDPGLTRVDPSDAAGVARALCELYDAWRQGALETRAPSEKLVKQFDAGEVAGRFLALAQKALRAGER